MRARAAVDLPVSDAFAVRVSAYRQVDDGFEGRYGARQNYNKTDQAGLRVNSILHLGDSLTWRLSLNYGRNQGTIPLTYMRSRNYYPNANIAAGTFGPIQTIYDETVNPGQDQVTDNRIDLTYYAARSRG